MASVRGVLIGVAAERAGMHPQTLRVYERRGLIHPRRSAGNTRLYSDEDIRLACRIQQLSDAGHNHVGVERILELEQRLARAERRIADLRAELAQTVADHHLAVARMQSARGELVRVAATSTALVPRARPMVVRIRVRGER